MNSKQDLIPRLPDDVAELCLRRLPYDHLYVLNSVCERWRKLIRSTDFHNRRRLDGLSRPVLLLQSPYTITTPAHDEQNYLAVFDPTSGNTRMINPALGILLRDISNRNRFTSIGAGRFLVIIGDEALSASSVRIYNFHTRIWSEGADMPGPIRFGLAAAWDGSRRRIFVAGGWVGTEPSRSAMYYDMEDDRWELLPDVPENCLSAQAAFSGGVFYLFHKSNDRDDWHRMSAYNVSTGEWSVTELDGNDNSRRLGYLMTMSPDGRMFHCSDNGVLRVKDNGEAAWRDLIALPPDVGWRPLAVTSWKGGVFVAGTGNFPAGQFLITDLNFVTLRFANDDQTPMKWTSHDPSHMISCPMYFDITNKLVWLEL